MIENYGGKVKAVSAIDGLGKGESMTFRISDFGGLTKFRNALGYYLSGIEGKKFSSRVGFPDSNIIHVKRVG